MVHPQSLTTRQSPGESRYCRPIGETDAMGLDDVMTEDLAQ